MMNKNIKRIALTGLMISALTINIISAVARNDQTNSTHNKKEKRLTAKKSRIQSPVKKKRLLEATKNAQIQMNRLQEKASNQLSTMSQEERDNAANIATAAQQKMSAIWDRLMAMTPEERTQEIKKIEAKKDGIMNQLKKNNRDVYNSFKALEELGKAHSDLQSEDSE